jgi:hypothetical protein
MHIILKNLNLIYKYNSLDSGFDSNFKRSEFKVHIRIQFSQTFWNHPDLDTSKPNLEP